MSTSGQGRLAPVPFRTDLLGLHELDPQRYPALIESTAPNSPLGRFDVLFAFPEQRLELAADGQLSGEAGGEAAFLSAFDAWWRKLRRPADGGGPAAFTGGWFVLLGYELANEIEPRLRLPTEPRQPVAVALRIPVAVVRDRVSNNAWICAEAGRDAAVGQLQADIARLPERPLRNTGSPLVGELGEDDPAEFLGAVRQVQSRIAAGDVYQANLSRQWRGCLRADVRPADVYRALRATNPAPFAGIVDLPGLAVISSSPERLLRSDGRCVETRPIAGTRPRDGGDDAGRRDLRDHPKERAEHVMLIDLERNDLGRVCRPGTVSVDEFMVVETYAHVHHLVSNVRGELRADATPSDVIRAVFPGGSITGCPKVRCMQIIRELEKRPRGVYTGAMGYINRDGGIDLNILIRTIALMGDEVVVATGSGIVADSDPQLELDETCAKARGLLLALKGGG